MNVLAGHCVLRQSHMDATAQSFGKLAVPSWADDTPSPCEIEARAYAMWVARGRPDGAEISDWLEAEAEIRKVREALAQNRLGFNAIIQGADAVIFSLGPDYRIFSWNAAAEQFHGRSRHDVLGRNYLELCLPPSEQPAAAATVRKAIGSEPVVQAETRVLTRDGTERVLSWHAARVLTGRGQVSELLVVGQDVTERRKAEEAWQQHHALWQLVLDQAPAVLWSTDAELRFTSSVGAGLSALGLYPGEAVGRTVAEFFGTQDPDHPAVAAHRRALAGEPSTYEQAWGGRTYQSHVESFRGPRGAVAGTVGVALDVTSRKQAEEDLREAHSDLERRVAARTAELSQANAALRVEIRHRERAEEATKNSDVLYRSLVENLPQNIFRKDLDGRFIFANERFCATVGRPLEEILGRTDADFFPAELAEKYRHDDALVTSTGEPFETTEDHFLPSGRRVYVHVVKTALRDYRGAVVGTQAIFWDVTPQKQAEEDLRDRDARLQLAMEGGRMGIWDWDISTGAVTWFRSLEAVHGFPRHDRGTLTDYLQTVHPGDRDAVARAVARAVEQRADYHVEYRVLWPDGTVHWVEGKGRLFDDSHARTVRLLGVCTDITDRKRAEQWTAAEHAVTRALVEATSLKQAAPTILRTLCECMNWDAGAVWRMDPRAKSLRRLSLWQPTRAGNAGRTRTRHAPDVTVSNEAWITGQFAWMRADGDRGAVAFPIRGSSEVLGVLEFYGRRIREPDDVLRRMVANVVSQIGQFLERRRAERALRVRAEKFAVARKIQQGLLPASFPSPPGLDIAGGSWPTEETGGDYYDCFGMPGGRLGIAIGDASGHGIGAALLIAATRGYVRALASGFADAGHILELANRHLAEDAKREYFVTLFLARIDPAARTLDYASAGHSAGYVFGPSGEVKAELGSTGMPLGVDPDDPIPTAPQVAFAAGDLILLLTDGVLEARSPDDELFGTARVLEVVRDNLGKPAADTVAAIRDAVWQFARNAVADDVTAVAIRVLD